MNRQQWLAERRTGIGSSDAAALCGLSPWQTPLHVYASKVYGRDQPETAPMRWGLLLEEAIAAAYQEQTGATIEPGGFFRDESRPWMLATPDRFGHWPNAEPRIVELKTCNAFAADEWGEPGTDEVPPYYLVQVQHQLSVTGLALADVAVLIGGSDFRVYHLQRSDEAIAGLVEIEAAFWERVQRRDPPEPDWMHGATPRLLDALHQPDADQVVTLDDEAQQLAEEYLEARSAASLADERKTLARAKLIHLMGAAGNGLLPGGQTITRRETDRKGYTVKATTYIDFCIKEPKGARST